MASRADRPRSRRSPTPCRSPTASVLRPSARSMRPSARSASANALRCPAREARWRSSSRVAVLRHRRVQACTVTSRQRPAIRSGVAATARAMSRASDASRSAAARSPRRSARHPVTTRAAARVASCSSRTREISSLTRASDTDGSASMRSSRATTLMSSPTPVVDVGRQLVAIVRASRSSAVPERAWPSSSSATPSTVVGNHAGVNGVGDPWSAHSASCRAASSAREGSSADQAEAAASHSSHGTSEVWLTLAC